MSDHYPTFDEAGLTVQDLANQTIGRGGFHSGMATVVPEPIASTVLCTDNIVATSNQIDGVRFVLQRQLATEAPGEDIAALINSQTIMPDARESVAKLVQEIRFLAALGQTIIHQ